MTQSTEQERAILYKGFCEWCKTVPHLDLDPHLHTHGGRIEDGGYIADTATAKAFAAWKAARRAPVGTVPQVTPEMVAAAEDAYMPFGDMELAIQCALSAAPQPPVAAPVELPEYGIDTANHAGIRVRGYTEHQVRQLLAAHDITQEQP